MLMATQQYGYKVWVHEMRERSMWKMIGWYLVGLGMEADYLNIIHICAHLDANVHINSPYWSGCRHEPGFEIRKFQSPNLPCVYIQLHLPIAKPKIHRQYNIFIVANSVTINHRLVQFCYSIPPKSGIGSLQILLTNTRFLYILLINTKCATILCVMHYPFLKPYITLIY